MPGAFDHGGQLAERDVARQVDAAAVGVDHEALGGHDFERAPDAVGDERGRLDLLRLHVDDAEAQRERRLELPEQLQVFFAAPGELERDGVHLGLENRGEQVPVAALERRLAVAVPVADVQRDVGVDALHGGVDRLDGPRQILREPRVVRFVDLEFGRARPRELLELEVQRSRQVEREGLLAGVELVPDALDEGVRARHRDLLRALAESLHEAHFLHEPERPGRELRPHDALVEVVVEALRSEIDLHAGQPLGEVVDHVVALELAVGDDVDAGDFLVLDRGFSYGVVHLVEVAAAQAARQVVVLRAFQPLGHRVAADHGCRENGQLHTGSKGSGRSTGSRGSWFTDVVWCT